MNGNLKLFGARLKEAIDEKGKTVDEISKATKIRKVFIEALINGDRDNLPDEVFVLGYLRAILNFLGTAPDSYVEEYKMLSKRENIIEEKRIEEFSPLPKIRSKNHLLVWLVIVALMLFFSAFFLFRNSILEIGTNLFSHLRSDNQSLNKDLPALSSNEDKTKEVVTKEEIKQNEEQIPSTQEETQIPPEGLTIISLSKCWIELFDENNKVLLRKELSEKEEFNFKGKKFIITLGDSSAVRLFFGGKEVNFLKQKGKVLKNLVISGEPK